MCRLMNNCILKLYLGIPYPKLPKGTVGDG